VAHEMRCGHQQGTYPRDRKRQHKVAGDRMASDEGLTGFPHRGTIAQTALLRSHASTGYALMIANRYHVRCVLRARSWDVEHQSELAPTLTCH
jgi:hypothetical protein